MSPPIVAVGASADSTGNRRPKARVRDQCPSKLHRVRPNPVRDRHSRIAFMYRAKSTTIQIPDAAPTVPVPAPRAVSGNGVFCRVFALTLASRARAWAERPQPAVLQTDWRRSRKVSDSAGRGADPHRAGRPGRREADRVNGVHGLVASGLGGRFQLLLPQSLLSVTLGDGEFMRIESDGWGRRDARSHIDNTRRHRRRVRSRASPSIAADPK